MTNSTLPLRRLGRTGLKVSALSLGTMQFGWTADEATSHAVLDAYAEAGGNFIDTADIYSNWAPGNPGGVSEEIIGRWLQERDRSDFVVATKVRGPMGGPLREGLSKRWILQAAEESLSRLNIDYIDLYQVHWPDLETPIEETLEALTDLVRSGLVRYIGASNFPAWRLTESLWKADKHSFARFDSLQPEYSIAAPVRASFERELAILCQTHGIGVIPYSPLSGGFLTGKYRKGQPLPDSERAGGIQRRFFSDQNFAVVEELVRVADAHGAKPAQVALAWLLAKPYMTAPIIGANSVEQLRDLLPAATLRLTPEDITALDEVSKWERARTDV
ncbi:aldo/keto reductase [Deinococcus yavapaiensis]|uniref:Aryl-alcohol dehydrogenase-like predicted oxidoreductase n=1 Tax=Deinococcus yavapaiensis KR-236 TaxID=694435 RepID=A0A318S4D6_9DEIO|nr:aldo/keto reductase [Deinococcus yavapaiensis]PYE51928.1 aryl-alcohol dehydrogenase-like predicted oxidoreductase [Deinococcus yavapaiensis KR-236]